MATMRRSYSPRRPSSQRTQPSTRQPVKVSLRSRRAAARNPAHAAGGCAPISAFATITCTNPDGCCVVASFTRSTRSTISGAAVTQPSRQPGATVFENVSSRTTRPSTSRLRNEGTSESRNG